MFRTIPYWISVIGLFSLSLEAGKTNARACNVSRLVCTFKSKHTCDSPP